ncbi:uncharacterized protein LOC107883838 [Acyrthosiphon pisum]|uniref:Junctophilin n=2 Tax=Aphidinae TaxID=133076 RepID=A0A8R2H4V1_ACYPI|nr:uncharacterized protein LOC107883838 [Acyrthosiphon pisum]XP_026821800.1 uncharacterized protein LOC113560237 [Rhopalosiphum maidis]XP_060860307.1 uncharacterized protein LOC132937503 [Metopolophium dirhodum]|eukprot:XP_016660175.1 PREDICTED: uncharacterized protein LOC107883838 [Acyrthosiphon pisum]
MSWFFSADDDEEDENLLFSPALMARRASESWIDTPPIEEVPVQMALQRKKSLPDVQVPLNAPASITREEVSVLSSARREEMRRVEEENERLRANPLLYLVSPHMKDWFTRQQLVLVILIVNISLALMFFKLLTS